MSTLGLWLKNSREQLSAVSDTPDIEARLCVSHVLNVSNSYLYSFPERTLTELELNQLNTLLNKRLEGQPLAYLFGYWHFFDLKLEVAPCTLIPRPDTEVLVEKALSLPLTPDAKVLDLGTGTGAIALSLAANKPSWQVVAVDYITEAVALAKRNQAQLNINNCQILQSDWFSALEGEKFDLIVSNPPYIDPQDPHLLNLKHEPITALSALDNGMADIANIIKNAPKYLNNKGWLYLEHGFDQALKVQKLLQEAGFSEVSSTKDYGDNWRITGGCYIA